MCKSTVNNDGMGFVNKGNVYLKNLHHFRRCELQGINGHSALMNPPRAASPHQDLLEFSADYDVSHSVPVAQWLEQCVSSAKVVGSIPREHMY